MKVYQYPKCSTCKKAIKFLKDNDVEYREVDIVENPPSLAELKRALKQLGQVKKLFNTSGQLYREMNLSQRLPELSDAEALKLLNQNGKLVKRPFVASGDTVLVGFKDQEWQQAFG